jgi:hypothetical protein
MDDTSLTKKYIDHCWVTNFYFCSVHQIKTNVEYESTNYAMLSEEGTFSLKFQPAFTILQARKLNSPLLPNKSNKSTSHKATTQHKNHRPKQAFTYQLVSALSHKEILLVSTKMKKQ